VPPARRESLLRCRQRGPANLVLSVVRVLGVCIGRMLLLLLMVLVLRLRIRVSEVRTGARAVIVLLLSFPVTISLSVIDLRLRLRGAARGRRSRTDVAGRVVSLELRGVLVVSEWRCVLALLLLLLVAGTSGCGAG